MNEEDAIAYLKRKNKIESYQEEYSEEDKKEIENVMKRGKIYGDPMVLIE